MSTVEARELGTESTSDELMLWLMAAGFGMGAALFVAGAVLGRDHAQVEIANTCYAIGALLFTAAATVQWRAAVAHHPDVHTLRRRAEAAITNPDWVSAIVQLLGTLEFNLLTIRALLATTESTDLSSDQLWRPDAMGSALFLIASAVAWHPISRLRRHRRLPRRSGWVCALNVLGSVAFACSAIAAYPEANGTILNASLADIGTLVGGLFFLAGAALLWPSSDVS